MSADTSISWATKTWNPTVGCEHVSPGCDNCYAKTLHDMRHAAFNRGKLQNIPQYGKRFEEVQTIPDRLTDPLGWREPQRVFVNSVSDVFHKDVPLAFVDRIMITIAQAPRHTFMILTKRPARMRAYSQELAKLTRQQRGARMARSQYAGTWMEKFIRNDMPGGMDWPLPNLIFGVSAENQATADQRIPVLLQTPAAVRFASCEPLLGPLDITLYLEEEGYLDDQYVPPLDWVITGGESGKNARPMHPEWARSLRDQCTANHTAFHFKQWGEHDAEMNRVGTKRAGRELDGRTWDEFPSMPRVAS